MYTTDHIFPFLPIKHMVNQEGEPTMPHKLATVTKPSVSKLCILFCLCVVRKATAYIKKKAVNMHHQSQTGFVESLLEYHNIKRVPRIRT